MPPRSIHQLNVQNQHVLLRVDFNVPLDPKGLILDDTRIVEAIPTIRYILDHGGFPVLMSHLGRPQGKKTPLLSLSPCAKRLSELLHCPVILAPDCIGKETESIVQNMKPGTVVLLENLRFHAGEESPEQEPGFVESLARLGDLYINDAFGTAHRAHASTAMIARFFPEKKAMGLLIQKELQHLSGLLQNPKRPFFAIIGGGKVSSKAGVIQKLLPQLDALFVGGKMAFPFLAAQNVAVHPSLYEPSDFSIAQDILQLAQKKSIPIYLPVDFQAVKATGPNANPKSAQHFVQIKNLDGWIGKDIGPQTVQEWSRLLISASTIFWNGPLGVYEEPPFDQGTQGIAQTLAHCTANVVVGGGDSVAAIQRLGLSSHFTHLSTGGGAALEFLELGHLPGIDALN